MVSEFTSLKDNLDFHHLLCNKGIWEKKNKILVTDWGIVESEFFISQFYSRATGQYAEAELLWKSERLA